jgi:hypothetical protein
MLWSWTTNYAGFNSVKLGRERMELNEALIRRDITEQPAIQMTGRDLKWKKRQVLRLDKLSKGSGSRAAKKEREDE